jgi:hypothetical protein
MDKTIWQRQMRLEEILSEGMRLFRGNLLLTLSFVLLVHAPVNLFRTYFFKIFPIEVYGEATTSFMLSGIKVFDSFLSLVVFIGIAYIVEKSIQAQEIRLSNVLKFSLSKIIDVFWVNILTGVIILGWSLLLIVPGIIWSNFYAFTLAIVSLRETKGMAALEASKRLVMGQWWRVFAYHVSIGALAILVNLPVFILAKKVVDFDFLYVFVPLTFFNFVGAITFIMIVVLFLNTEYVKALQKQNNR